MKIKYDDEIYIKIQKKLKEAAEDKAVKKGKTLSQYIRDLILMDVKGI